MCSDVRVLHHVGMAAQITQIITSASGYLPNLVLVAVVTVVIASLTTGLGGRLAIRVGDLRYRRRLARVVSRTA